MDLDHSQDLSWSYICLSVSWILIYRRIPENIRRGSWMHFFLFFFLSPIWDSMGWGVGLDFNPWDFSFKFDKFFKKAIKKNIRPLLIGSWIRQFCNKMLNMKISQSFIWTCDLSIIFMMPFPWESERQSDMSTFSNPIPAITSMLYTCWFIYIFFSFFFPHYCELVFADFFFPLQFQSSFFHSQVEFDYFFVIY